MSKVYLYTALAATAEKVQFDKKDGSVVEIMNSWLWHILMQTWLRDGQILVSQVVTYSGRSKWYVGKVNKVTCEEVGVFAILKKWYV